jgi:hypothetical protein|tara:strand:- start:173 stop:1738 length:1566 start_codon:yes stop_codon:yes gene_type:complete
MAKITQTVNSYTINSDGAGSPTGAIQIDDGATFAGAIITAGGLRVDSLNTIGLMTTSVAGVLTTTATTDGAIILGSAGVGFSELLAGAAGSIVQDNGAAYVAVAVSGDVLLAAGGAATLQSVAITGQTASATADDADLILIYDDTATALRKQTRANFLAGAAGTPAGADGEVQYNNGGAFGADAAFTTNKAGLVTVQNLVVGANTTAIDLGAAGSATIFGAVGANTLTVGGSTSTVVIPGSLTVEGTTTFIDTANLRIEDAVIDLNSDAAGAGVGSNNGAGLNILSSIGANTITFTALSDGGAMSSSSGLDVATGKEYSINGTSVLNATTLGSGVVTSSLTTVGTIGTGVWQGTTVGVAYGGTGQTSYTDGQLLIGNSTGNTLNKATLTAGAGITITNGSGAITIEAAGSSSGKVTGTYAAGVTQNIDFAIPTGSRTNVGFSATIYLEDTVTANSALVTDEGIVTRSTGAPILPDFLFVVVPGTDGLNVSLGTGGANTLRFVVNTPAGSGNYVATVEFTED